MSIKIGSFILLLTSLVVITHAQNPLRLAAKVDRETINLSEQLEYELSIEGGVRSLPEPEAPSFDGFRIVRGPSTSTQVQIVNGAMSSRVNYSYTLQAIKEGKWTIGPASVSLKGQTYRSNPITVEVIKMTAQKLPSGQSGEPASEAGDEASIPRDRVSDLFVWASVDEPSPYVGQTVRVAFHLFTRLQVNNFDVQQTPAFTGFWTEEAPLPKNPEVKKQLLYGKEYAVAKIYEALIHPTVSGELLIDPLTAIFDTRSKGRDPFDDFFSSPFGSPFMNGRRETRSSQSLSLTAKSLPVEGKPATFSGAVGEYEIHSSLSKSEIAAGEGVTFTITLSGNQSLKMVGSPTITPINNVKIYEPQAGDESYLIGKTGWKTKNFEYIMVPYTAGEYETPIVSFSFFNPILQKYGTVSCQPLRFKASGSFASVQNAELMNEESGEVKLLGRDIRYIKTVGRVRQMTSDYKQPWFFCIIILPLLCTPLIIAYGRHKRRLIGDEAYARSFRARSESMQRFSRAQKELQNGSLRQALDECFKAMTGYLGDRLNLPIAGMTFRGVQQELSMRVVDSITIEKIVKYWDELDYARFSSIQPSPDLCREMIKEGQIIIEVLERVRPKSAGVRGNKQ